MLEKVKAATSDRANRLDRERLNASFISASSLDSFSPGRPIQHPFATLSDHTARRALVGRSEASGRLIALAICPATGLLAKSNTALRSRLLAGVSKETLRKVRASSGVVS